MGPAQPGTGPGRGTGQAGAGRCGPRCVGSGRGGGHRRGTGQPSGPAGPGPAARGVVAGPMAGPGAPRRCGPDPGCRAGPSAGPHAIARGRAAHAQRGRHLEVAAGARQPARQCRCRGARDPPGGHRHRHQRPQVRRGCLAPERCAAPGHPAQFARRHRHRHGCRRRGRLQPGGRAHVRPQRRAGAGPADAGPDHSAAPPPRPPGGHGALPAHRHSPCAEPPHRDRGHACGRHGVPGGADDHAREHR